MIYFSIKDLENFSGIKAHTIRTWEQRFSFLAPKRSEGLRRTYDCDELKLILNVSFLNRNGYKVSHIARMDKEEMDALLLSLSDLNHRQEKAVNELICYMAVMDVQGFELMLQNCVSSWGVAITIADVIMPFSKKTGLLQQRDQKNYQAHLLLIEQSLKQKIIMGIEKAGITAQAKTALFFLLKKKSELELLYLQYELKMAGLTVVYISSQLQMSQLQGIVAATKPSYIITSAGGKNPPFDATNFLSYLNEELPQTVFVNIEENGLVNFPIDLQTPKGIFGSEESFRWQQKEGLMSTN